MGEEEEVGEEEVEAGQNLVFIQDYSEILDKADSALMGHSGIPCLGEWNHGKTNY